VAILETLQALDAETIEQTLDSVRAWAKASGGRDEPVAMTVEHLRTLADAGVAVGAHTRTHRGLAYAAPDDQRAEVRRSRQDLEVWLGRAPTAFAYPFGVPGADVDAATIAIVREAAFECAVVNRPGPVTAHSDAFAIPRSAVPALDAAAFAHWLVAFAP
jgi:peptidoglycan/xylan/chitin deacetylase (PgdA/CDA1 family)